MSNSRFKGSPRVKKDKGGVSVAPKAKKRDSGLLNEFWESGPFHAELTLGIRAISEVNSCEHWTAKHKRHAAQKALVSLALEPRKRQIRLPCRLTLTRYAPRKLDKHDNLPISMKYILDQVCAILTGDYRHGRADDDERIAISYAQETSKSYGVKIRFDF